MSAQTAVRPEIPFLGLHYFDEEHENLFFGRDEQLRDLLAKLAGSRFVSVIGSSGTGKSSLARAGLVPALRAGFFIAAGSKWRILKIRPGSSPIYNLAHGMESVFGRAGVEVTLRRGPLGLAEAARQCGLGEHENLLIMVDQFEEIFRYQREAKNRQAAAEEASSFVKQLLEATARVDRGIFVLITMRSDYLGICAQFRDLPERINSGLYLIPRMRRDQLEDAITGPAAVAGARFSPPLVQKLLNDAGEDPDQLSVLQHALLRAWLNWKTENHPSQEIDFRHYDATGGVRDGLDNHAEEIYGKLNSEDKKIAEIVFRCLTERDPSNNDIRRPTELGVIAAIAGVQPSEVRRVADAFRGEGVSFLTPTAPSNLDENTLVDITHESLIRKWYRLGGTKERRGWVQAEAEVREQYRELVKRARRALPRQEVLTGADLSAALEWRAQRLRPAWSRRYENAEDAFEIVSRYIERSKRRRLRNLILKSIAIVIVLAAGVALKVHDERVRDAAREAEIRREEQDKRGQIEQERLKVRADSEETLRKKAEEFRAIATARQLTSQADGLKDKDSRIEVSALLAIESLKRKALPEGIQALRAPMALLHRALWTKEAKRPKSMDEESEDDVDLESITASHGLQFSPNGQYIAQVSDDAKVRVYQVASGKELSLAPLSEKADSLAWNGNQLYVLAAHYAGKDSTNAVVFAISLTGGAATEVLRKPCSVLCLLTTDGKYLMVTQRTQQKHAGQLYPLAGGQPLPLAEAGRIIDVGQESGFLLREVEGRESRRGGTLSVSDLRNKVIGEVEGNSSSASDDRTPVYDIGGNSGYIALVGQNRVVRIYQTQSQLKLVGQIVSTLDPAAIALSPDGQLIAIADTEGGARVVDWAIEARRAAWSHASSAVAIAFSPDSKSVASVDQSGELRIIPLEEGSIGRRRNGLDQSPLALPDQLPLELNTRVRATLAATFDPSERFLLIRQASSFAQLFDATRGTEVLLGADGAAMISISEEGHYAATVSPSGAAQLVNLTTGLATPLEKLGIVGWLALSPAAKYLAFRPGTTRANHILPIGSARIWDMSSGSSNDLPAGASFPVFSPDGRWLFLRREKSPGVELMKCGTWSVARAWDFNWRTVFPIFSHDGRFLFVRGASRAADSERQSARNYLLIDTESNQERTLLLPEKTTVSSARFSPEGRLLAIATSDLLVRVFELPSGKLFTTISVDFVAGPMVFSHASHYLGMASGSGAPRVFELPSGVEVSRAGLDEKERLLAFHFSRDERSLFLATTSPVSGEAAVEKSQEAAIKRQYLFAEELIKQSCSRMSRNLTAEEWKSYLPDYPYERTCPDLADVH